MIVALAVGVVLLPLAFLHPNSAAVWGCLVGGMLLVVLVPLAFDRLGPSQHNADTGDITTPLTLK